MLKILKFGVILSFFYCVLSLFILIMKTFSYGKRTHHASPKCEAWRGIFYALGPGMLPWEKESASKRLPTYITGVFYHIGIFSALLYLLFVFIPLSLSNLFIHTFRILLMIGVVCGVALLLKRSFSLSMRAISCPDDYVSNALVNLFITIAFLHTFFIGVVPYLYLITILIFLYIPFGKIRHCFFFFYVRILLGRFFGRRNILPPQKKIGIGK